MASYELSACRPKLTDPLCSVTSMEHGQDYETFRQAHIKECHDTVSAVGGARNCLLYENDPGPDKLQVGYLSMPLLLPRSEAWQLTYAMGLLEDCRGDIDRLAAARVGCTSLCVRCPYRDGRWGRVELSRAIDLCDQALRMIEGARAADGERGARLLQALCDHETTMTALGLIAEVAESANSDFTVAMHAAGATMADVPRPETVVAWAFPWL